MASKQYNSPMKMYSEDIIEEIMTQGLKNISFRVTQNFTRINHKIDLGKIHYQAGWFTKLSSDSANLVSQKNAAKPSKKCHHSLQNHHRFNIHYLILGTAFGKEIDPSNPWNMTGKQFDAEKSSVLAAVMDDTTRVNKNHNIA